MTRPILLVIFAAFVVACATSPTGRSQLMLVSGSQMAEMGAAAFAQIKEQQPISRDARARAYVHCVTNALTAAIASEQRWEVELFEDESANAFALPGGHIGVHTGLLAVAKTDSQLAAVIGHEIAHVVAQHSAAQVSNQMATQLGVQALAGASGMSPELIGMGANLLLVMPYGRRDESEADRLGLTYMAEAGFDPRDAVALWHNMSAQGGSRSAEFLSTHPSPESRITELEARMPTVLPLYESARSQGRRPSCSR
ncbi:MAG: M48 family metallopeptidase [Gammaproteobacteria bacterium]